MCVLRGWLAGWVLCVACTATHLLRVVTMFHWCAAARVKAFKAQDAGGMSLPQLQAERRRLKLQEHRSGGGGGGGGGGAPPAVPPKVCDVGGGGQRNCVAHVRACFVVRAGVCVCWR